ncbi:MAG: GTPase HflX [Lachnospiraceae bacterium]|nr:GTPase HflX [Lachnospiraceae bacterium]
MIETKEKLEKFVLVGVQTAEGDDTADSLNELAELIKTAGGQVTATVIQNREAVHSGTYIGKGKVEEVKQLVEETDATGVVCDDELSPAQYKNLEDLLDCKVMDRTMVILDIFASHATTNEGKIQVELAQLRYRLMRLSGRGVSMSRLGGGIGTRGPGESKLESDRRQIRNRISMLKEELAGVVQSREVTRKARSKNALPVFSIVGYTNAGKSTLLNKLTDANILAEDKLFATLDPTTRNFKLSSGQEVLLTDTVGFIRKLPHHLIEAFKSTLEEAKYADIIIHVVDISNPDAEKQMHVVYDTLSGLGISDKKIITVFNKCDKETANTDIKDLRADKFVRISAKSGLGCDTLTEIMEDLLRESKILIEHTFSYDEGGKLALIRSKGELIAEEYTETGVYIKAYVPKEIYDKILIRH